MSNKEKILYLDDESVNLDLFQIHFKKKYIVLTALNGFKGLEILGANPDTMVIISDMKMPGMNGIEFIKKAKEKYPDKKYFILTGYEITTEIKEALNSGLIIEYFSKPFDIDRMHKVIANVLNN